MTPTKRELRAEIEALAAQVGASVSPERMNHGQLTALRDELLGKVQSMQKQTELPVNLPGFGGAVRKGSEEHKVEQAFTDETSTEEGAKEPVPAASEEPAQSGELEAPTSLNRVLVAERNTVTTLRGTLGAFQEVKPRDFPNGQADIDVFLKAGILVRG